eukprot:204577-Pleurochrysis_carterae.AAC.4
MLRESNWDCVETGERKSAGFKRVVREGEGREREVRVKRRGEGVAPYRGRKQESERASARGDRGRERTSLRRAVAHVR